jgi:tetratricopeptide (TPR) repeat protein
LAYAHAKLLKNPHYKAEALFLLGMDYYKNFNFTKSITLLKLGLLNSQNTSDHILQGIGYLRLGQNYFLMDDFDNATQFFGKAYLLFDSCGSIEYKCHVIDILGYIYMDFGNLEEAKRYFSLGRKLLVYDPKPYLIALSQLHYSLVLIKQNKASYAKEYLEYARRIAITTKDIPRLLAIEREICNFYFNLGYKYYAINILKESINKANRTGISYEEANSLNTLAHYYQQVGMKFLAIEAQKEVYTIRKKLNYTKIFCNALINMADAYTVVNYYDSALFYFNKGLELSISKGIKSEQTRAYRKMQAFYESNEKFREALFCTEKYQQMRAEFIENQSNNRAIFMQNSYNKQSAMEELLTIEQNRKWNYSLAGFITILILVIIFGTFGYGYL